LNEQRDLIQIVLFDGVCNFCNASVNFIIKRDNKNKFKFAALQSDPGQKLSAELDLQSENLITLILIEEDKYYVKTTAALRIVRHLRGLWKLLYFFIIIPPFVRNLLYDSIARYRYKWFGKRETCRVPAENEKSKFIL
jgi:predicted DCC family thiol-disulfide oxidoreductase YuxK